MNASFKSTPSKLAQNWRGKSCRLPVRRQLRFCKYKTFETGSKTGVRQNWREKWRQNWRESGVKVA